MTWSKEEQLAWEHENDAIIGAVYRREREARVKAERDARETAIARARAAAETWQREEERRTGKRVTVHPDAERLRRHVADLARQAPEVRIHWLDTRHRSTELVGRGNAVAYVHSADIVVPPVFDVVGQVTVDHELGHKRTNALSRLGREIAAWRWAREHALIWDRSAQDCMRHALGTYIQNPPRRHVLEVMEAERFLSDIEFKREQLRRRLLADTDRHDRR